MSPEEAPSTPSVHSERQTPLATLSHVNLPRLELHHFSGDPAKWVSFINLYDSTVHRNTALTSVVKFQYLLSILSGEPLALIKNFNISTANYLIVYNILRQRYHSTRRLVTLHLNHLIDLPDVSSQSVRGLRTFVNTFHEHSEALKAIECDVTTQANPLLSALLLRKLNGDLRKCLKSFRSSNEEETHTLPTVKDIILFLNTECNMSEDADLHSSAKKAPVKAFNQRSQKVTRFDDKHKPTALVTAHNINSSSCFACGNSDHKFHVCPTFLKLSPAERFQLVKRERKCFSCLRDHNLPQFQSSHTCKRCRKRHHTLLHLQSGATERSEASNQYSTRHQSAVERRHNTTHHRSIPQPRVAGTSPPADVTSPTPVTLSTTKTLPPVHPPQPSTVLLGTILVKLTAENGQSHVFRGLLDSGSTCNLITCQAASLLGARRYHSNIQIAGLSQHASNTRGMLSLQVNTLSGQLIAPDQEFHILDKISVNLPRAKISPELSHLVKHYTLADPTFDTPCGIDVLLGGTIIPIVFTQENHSLGPGLPHLIGTQFGFILMGTAPCVTPTEPVSNFSIALLSTHDNSLHTALQKFWVQEEPPIINHKSIEETKCDELFDSTHTRNGDGRYVVRLPFKTEPSCLGSSLAAAERRFVSLERKFQTQPQFAELYRNFMKDYKETGHMTLLDKHHADEPHYYLPHHGVIKEKQLYYQAKDCF
ncbi:uncharacterized protein LOC124372372 [Homalodisca vitripennis]|uniref:uncharacterized protein LOC124372372 n=1 Tax=Homalodisca vitripennis TaxID=197043 RepID=UPI001EEAF360|nr:uncharacterized protein LOC124372372 [Homalodisca vitripennis]